MEDIFLKEGFLHPVASELLFEHLERAINWVDELSNDAGETVKIKRKMAYISDTPVTYRYANLSFMGETWTGPLSALRNALTEELGVPFNSVLLNRYKDGKDEINWHSDKEASLGDKPVIACVNLGASRKFWFRKKGEGSEKFFLPVADGDLLVMGENCQRDYIHAILKESDVKEPRISLTFRYNIPELMGA